MVGTMRQAMRKAILFLDFDGVLHTKPSGSGRGPLPFEQMQLLEGILRRWTHLDVVVSSSWRESFTLQQLRNFFSDDLQHWIIAVTAITAVGARGSTTGRRQSECESGSE